MNGLTAATMAVALVAAMAGMPLGAAGGLADVQPQDDDVESTQPGERLGGVIGVQQAELDGELSDRTYGVKIAQAETDAAKAAVVNETLEDVEVRLATLEDRLEELEQAREDGEITAGQYNAEVAAVVAETRTVERLAEGTGVTVAEHNLEDQGIDSEAIDELRANAAELGGPEVAEIAQSIAGERVGQSVADDREPGAPIEVPGQDREDEREDRGETQDDEETANGPDDGATDDATDDA